MFCSRWGHQIRGGEGDRRAATDRPVAAMVTLVRVLGLGSIGVGGGVISHP
jgi:hypothetical protein